MNNFGVVLFHTTSSAMKAEKTLTQKGLKVKLIPTPRELSSDCGISLRFDLHQIENVRLLLSEANVQIDSIQKL